MEALSVAASIHYTYLSGIERGMRNPSWDRIRDLAQALEIEASELVRTAENVARDELRGTGAG
jgi:transcriptional regulator with XRE-family HTH domain